MNYSLDMLFLRKKVIGTKFKLNLKPERAKTLKKPYILSIIANYLKDEELHQLYYSCKKIKRVIKEDPNLDNKILRYSLKKLRKKNKHTEGISEDEDEDNINKDHIDVKEKVSDIQNHIYLIEKRILISSIRKLMNKNNQANLRKDVPIITITESQNIENDKEQGFLPNKYIKKEYTRDSLGNIRVISYLVNTCNNNYYYLSNNNEKKKLNTAIHEIKRIKQSKHNTSVSSECLSNIIIPKSHHVKNKMPDTLLIEQRMYERRKEIMLVEKNRRIASQMSKKSNTTLLYDYLKESTLNTYYNVKVRLNGFRDFFSS
jgi:hypothetical protein